MPGGITVTLMGEPVAWARTRLGARGVPFTPTRQRNNAATLRLAAQDEMAGREPFDCPLGLDLVAEFGIPASWSKRKQTAALLGNILPAKRPDLSNICKQIEDAFNGVIFRDDALIVEAHLSKRYSVQPKLIITVWPLEVTAPIISGLRRSVLEVRESGA